MNRSSRGPELRHPRYASKPRRHFKGIRSFQRRRPARMFAPLGANRRTWEDLLDPPSGARGIGIRGTQTGGDDLVDRALRTDARLARTDHGFFRPAHPRSTGAHLDFTALAATKVSSARPNSG
jgi:hypothetical protein